MFWKKFFKEFSSIFDPSENLILFIYFLSKKFDQGLELSVFIWSVHILFVIPDFALFPKAFFVLIFSIFLIKKFFQNKIKKIKTDKFFWLKFLKAKLLNWRFNQNQPWNYQKNLFSLENIEKILRGFVRIFEPTNSEPVLILHQLKFQTLNLIDFITYLF